jgi:hypothetical protein
MKTINIFILIISVLVVTSCRKHPPKTYTIKGQLLLDCSGIMVANTDLKIISKSQVFTQGFSAYSETDSNGYFSFNYRGNGGTDIALLVAGNNILEGIPNNRDIDLGVIYYHPTCNFVFKIVVDNPYPLGDTLKFPSYDFTGNSLYKSMHVFAAPLSFTDTTFYIYNYNDIQIRNYWQLDAINVRIGFSAFHNSADLYKSVGYDTLIPNCNWPPDTLLLVVE